MHRRVFLRLAAAPVAAAALPAFLGSRAALAAAPPTVTGPAVHANLAVYFVHGPSAPGPVPLTLQEAMAKGRVRVRETSDVNSLEIDNRGDSPVYVHSGDIVKGGKQDRVLMVSMVVPPRSGPLAIASFCVEQGRWAPRGREDSSAFASAEAALPSRDAKLAMKAPVTPAPHGPRSSHLPGETAQRQGEMWRSVGRAQDKLSRNVGATVAAPTSRTSLLLSMEHGKLNEMAAAYVAALKAAPEKAADALGFAFAINGAINSADVFAQRGLFLKMWPKLLHAAAIEAIGERDGKATPPPAAAAVVAFFQAAEAGKAETKAINGHTRLESRTAEKAMLFETRAGAPAAAGAPAGWVHRNYLAK
jgi:hypothetical protein